MTLEYDQLPLSKTQQRHKRKRKPTAVIDVYSEYPPFDGTEAQLQGQLDDLLSVLGIWFIRIPDGFFRWVKIVAPVGIQRFFFGMFGGIPDIMPLIKVSDKYMLCAPIELKSAKGALHGKQKTWGDRNIAFQLSRSPDHNIAIINQFQIDAAIVRGLFNAQELNKAKKTNEAQ